MENFDPSELFCEVHKKRLIALNLSGSPQKRLLCHHCLSDPAQGFRFTEIDGRNITCIDKVVTLEAILKCENQLRNDDNVSLSILKKTTEMLDQIQNKIERLKQDIQKTVNKMMKTTADQNLYELRTTLKNFSDSSRIWHGADLEKYVSNYLELHKQIEIRKRKEETLHGLIEPTLRECRLLDQALTNISVLWRYDKNLFKCEKNLIVSASYDRKVRVIDARKFEVMHSIENRHSDGITSVQLSNNQNFCVTSSTDRCVRIFSTARNRVAKIIRLNEIADRLLTLQISADGKLIYTAAQQSVFVLNAKLGKVLFCYKQIHEDTIWKMAATMDGRYILTGSSDKKIKILGIKTKQVLFVLDNLHIKCIDGLAVSSDSRLLITGSRDRTVCFVDLVTRDKLHCVTFETLVYAVAISPNQKLAAIGCEDGSIKLLDIFTRKLLYTFKKVHDKPISHLTFHSNSHQIISISWDKSLKVTNVDNFQIEYALNGLHNFDERRYTINDLSVST